MRDFSELASIDLEISLWLLDPQQKLLQLVVAERPVQPAAGCRVYQIILDCGGQLRLYEPDIREPLPRCGIKERRKYTLPRCGHFGFPLP